MHNTTPNANILETSRQVTLCTLCKRTPPIGSPWNQFVDEYVPPGTSTAKFGPPPGTNFVKK